MPPTAPFHKASTSGTEIHGSMILNRDVGKACSLQETLELVDELENRRLDRRFGSTGGGAAPTSATASRIRP